MSLRLGQIPGNISSAIAAWCDVSVYGRGSMSLPARYCTILSRYVKSALHRRTLPSMVYCTAERSPVVQLAGPLLIGIQFNWGLYGALLMQIYIYHQSGVPDNIATRVITYGLFVVETAQTILSTHDVWHELALSWGDCTGLIGLNLNWISVPIFTAFTSSIIQCYYAWRISILSRSRIFPTVVIILALLQFSSGVAEGISVLVLGSVPDTQAKTFKVQVIWTGSTALCDALIASLMVYYLSRGRTGFKSTDSAINKLIRITLETGLCTAILAIIQLCLFVIFQHNFYHFVPAFTQSKLYTNSLLVLLNSRLTIGHIERDAIDMDQCSSMVTANAFSVRPEGNTIQINVEHETYHDDGSTVKVRGSERPDDEYCSKTPTNVFTVV